VDECKPLVTAFGAWRTAAVAQHKAAVDAEMRRQVDALTRELASQRMARVFLRTCMHSTEVESPPPPTRPHEHPP